MNSRLFVAYRYLSSFLALVTVLTLAGGCAVDVRSGDQADLVVAEQPTVPVADEDAGARRLILVIGDGMGTEQLRAASLYKTGTENGLVLQSLPVKSSVATASASSSVTDSAAAGTALATAVKVHNGVVSVRIPGDGAGLSAITEELKDQGWAVGLVTTAFTTHATPATFGAHVESRLDYAGIARGYLDDLRPEVILGGGGYGMDPMVVENAGYTVVRSDAELTRAVDRVGSEAKVAGLFGDGHLPYRFDGRPEEIPGLVEMTRAAVDHLARNEEGFFLMIEGARIDHAGHANDIARLIPEVLELDSVVEMLLDHPALQEDTLLVVTADHETGGLAVTEDRGKGRVPIATWSTTGHTAADVPLFAIGPGSEAFTTVADNTQLRGAMMAARETGGTPEQVARAVTHDPLEERVQ